MASPIVGTTQVAVQVPSILAVLRLGHRPAATLELGNKLVNGHAGQDRLGCRQAWPHAADDGSGRGHLLVLEPLDEPIHLVAGELAGGLSLGEPHRTPGIAEIGVTGVVQEGQQLFHLPGRGRRPQRLTECHARSLAHPRMERSVPPLAPRHTGDVTSAQSQKQTQTAGWADPDQVDWYLDRIDRLPPRIAGEDMLREVLPRRPETVLDLGCGDGRLAALVLEARPTVRRVLAVDRSPAMLGRARERFTSEPRVTVRQWDLADPIVPLGNFDVVVSGFAIHHLESPRKRDLFSEVARQLRPDGLFANLEVVASATPELHAEFLAAIGRIADDPEDRLVDVETQARWMSEAGFEQVDCLWRWRGFALLVGRAR